MLQTEKSSNLVAREEFRMESELLSRIKHPNIVRILGCGKLPRPFLILEKLRPMDSILDLHEHDNYLPTGRKRRFLTYQEILNHAKDLAEAFKYIHQDIHPQAMLIHRDLKLENIGITQDGTLKLLDFGLCRVVHKRKVETSAYEMTGGTGSLRYMAPEVVLHKPYTEKVDVYSFALVLYAMARNQEAFRGYSPQLHYSEVVMKGIRPKLESNWPLEFQRLLTACWDEDSTKRPSFVVIVKAVDDAIKNLQNQFSPANHLNSRR